MGIIILGLFYRISINGKEKAMDIMRIKRFFRELFEKGVCRFKKKCRDYSGRGICNKYGIRFAKGFTICEYYRKLRDEGQ